MKKLSIYITLLFSNLMILAQEKDSLTLLKNNRTNYKKIAPYIIPTTLLVYGASSLYVDGVRNIDYQFQKKISASQPNFSSNIDSYTQYLPAATIVGLELLGVKGKNHNKDKIFIFALSFAMYNGIVRIQKNVHARLRPDESEFNSFPSGHTTTAFATAELLNQEYKNTQPWVGYLGYVVASGTGIMRMYNNKHWFSDVVMGAGVGIVSTKLAYLIYPSVKRIFTCKSKKESNFSLVPNYQNGNYGLSLNGRF
ncbi:MAG: phosphatase PAP2 family protein [Sphingobacteriaceae bacterium]|nr:phosphatase PAP2 family protein [Sphingobacteriaceae bacterium]